MDYFCPTEQPLSNADFAIIYPGSEFIDYGNNQPTLSQGSPQISDQLDDFNFSTMNYFGQPEMFLGMYPASPLIGLPLENKKAEVLSTLESPLVSTEDSSQEGNKYNSPQADSDEAFDCALISENCFEEVRENEPKKSQKKTDSLSSPKTRTSAIKCEGNQSIFKNKYKELNEQSKASFDEIYRDIGSKIAEIAKEMNKTKEEWERDGERLRQTIEIFESEERILAQVQERITKAESQAKRLKAIDGELTKLKKAIKELKGTKTRHEREERKVMKKLDKAKLAEKSLKEELKILKEGTTLREQGLKEDKKELKKISKKIQPLRSKILEALKFKRLVCFAPLFGLMDQIKLYVGEDDSVKFFESYKKKRSMKYFESYAEKKELFYWIIIMKMVLTLLPKESEILTLLPLSQATTPFMSWLMDSAVMKVKHKTLFKEFPVRAHLRKEFERVSSVLLAKAQNLTDAGEWEKEKWETLMNVLNALGGVEDMMNRSGLASPVTHDSSKRTYEEFEEEFDYFESEDEDESYYTKKKVFL